MFNRFVKIESVARMGRDRDYRRIGWTPMLNGKPTHGQGIKVDAIRSVFGFGYLSGFKVDAGGIVEIDLDHAVRCRKFGRVDLVPPHE